MGSGTPVGPEEVPCSIEYPGKNNSVYRLVILEGGIFLRIKWKIGPVSRPATEDVLFPNGGEQ